MIGDLHLFWGKNCTFLQKKFAYVKKTVFLQQIFTVSGIFGIDMVKN